MDINSIVDQMALKQIEREKAQEIVIERIEDYRAALNRIFSMNEGKLLAKYLLKFSGIYTEEAQLNPAKEIENKGRRSYYLKMIRPYLDREIRMEIENA